MVFGVGTVQSQALTPREKPTGEKDGEKARNFPQTLAHRSPLPPFNWLEICCFFLVLRFSAWAAISFSRCQGSGQSCKRKQEKHGAFLPSFDSPQSFCFCILFRVPRYLLFVFCPELSVVINRKARLQ
uniref:Uncharacterized protein n=1 Tax=Myotis myotis TaxID=51298 RepID=A0A7J7ZXA1_MYOMY|nr:hypothetical protein mMyoMyo1_009707 [Myotis myotis]